MTAINLEMMRQLIEEFTEKEAITREEIQVVEQQIKELEQRIVESKKQLETTSLDRQKVLSMKERYSGSQEELSFKSHAEAETGRTKQSQAISNSNVTAQALDTMSFVEPNLEAGSQTATSSFSQDVASDKAALPTTEIAPDQADERVEPGKDEDTVRNINDALRRLFR